MKTIIEPANKEAPVVVVLSTPDGDELRKGRAFVGSRAKLLSSMFTKAGFDIKKDLMFVHAYPTLRAGRSSLTQKQLDEHKDRVQNWITEHPRKLIIPMGNSAAYVAGVLASPKGIQSIQGRERKGVDDIKVVATNDPYILTREPEQEHIYLADLTIAKRVMDGKKASNLPPIKIKYINSPRDVKKLYKRIMKSPYRAASYDYETDTLNPKKVTVTCLAFCVGETKPGSGVYECWFYRNEKRLKRVRSPRENKKLLIFLAKLFDKAGTHYDLIAHNGPFDDWVTYEQMPVTKFQGSTHDSMIESYIVDNATRNGLKDQARAIGYPDYDQEVDTEIKKIVARRNKNLEHPLDFKILKRHGVEPRVMVKRDGTKVYKWPDTKLYPEANKKLGAWAILHPKLLKIYNCYDVVMTWKIHFDWLLPTIQKEDLVNASEFRHRIARMLLRAEMYGFRVNVGLNRAWSKKCKKIEKDCYIKMQDILERRGFDSEFADNFNANSGPQLQRILFGESVRVPKIHVDDLADAICKEEDCVPDDLQFWYIQGVVDDFHNKFYKDGKAFQEAVEDGSFDYDATAKELRREFYRQHGVKVKASEGLIFVDGTYTPKVFTKTGLPSVSRAILEGFGKEKKDSKGNSKGDDFLSLLLMYRRAEKARSTFIDGVYALIDEHNILRSHFNPIGAKTGRISSSRPNGQNFIKYLRGQCIPRPGNVFVEFDLSQAELRVIAALSKDKALLKALRLADNTDAKELSPHKLKPDVHTMMAAQIFKCDWKEVTAHMRGQSKTTVFGTLYGISARGLSIMLEISMEDAQILIDDFFDAYKQVHKWVLRQHEKAAIPPHFAYTPFGTRTTVKNVISRDFKKQGEAKRLSANMPIQGGAAEYTLWVLDEVLTKAQKKGIWVALTNTTHDSGCFECAKENALEIQELIAETVSGKPPVKVFERIEFKADIEITTAWSGQPSLLKALDPKLSDRKTKLDWSLLDPTLLDKDERKELMELGFYQEVA